MSERHLARFRAGLISLLVRNSGRGQARGILRIWPLWEEFSHKLWPSQVIPNAPHSLFSLHFTQHRGAAFLLPDNIEIWPGDPVAEIHFNNHVFVSLLSNTTGTERWASVRLFREDLRAVADWAASGTMPTHIKALFGVTVLGRGAARLGFTLRPRKNTVRNRLDRLFLDGLLILYSPEGQHRMTVGKTVQDQPVDAWMSIDHLLHQYGVGDYEGSLIARSSDSV